MASLFGDQVDAILLSDSLGKAPEIDDLGGATFNAQRDVSRMRPEISDAFVVPQPTGTDASAGAMLIDAALGTLLDRQNMYGSFMRYPRTFVVGPRASFGCSGTLNAGWSKSVSADVTDSGELKERDYDQLVWVNHCPDIRVGEPPTIQINVAYFDQRRRDDSEISVVLDRVLFRASGVPQVGFRDPASSVDKQFDTLVANLQLGAASEDARGSKYTYAITSFSDRGVFTIEDDKDPLAYVKTASAVLEKIMRIVRTPAIKPKILFTVPPPNHVQVMHRAVLSGVVPYAHADLDAEQRVPAPMPGEATFDRLFGIMENLLDYPVEGSEHEEVGTSNPYITARASARTDSELGETDMSSDDEDSDLF